MCCTSGLCCSPYQLLTERHDNILEPANKYQQAPNMPRSSLWRPNWVSSIAFFRYCWDWPWNQYVLVPYNLVDDVGFAKRKIARETWETEEIDSLMSEELLITWIQDSELDQLLAFVAFCPWAVDMWMGGNRTCWHMDSVAFQPPKDIRGFVQSDGTSQWDQQREVDHKM